MYLDLARHIEYIAPGALAILLLTLAGPTIASMSVRDSEWQRADALISASKDREGIQILDHVYALTVHSTASANSKQLDEARILAEEIEPLRSLSEITRLKSVLADFARIANSNSQPQASLFPPMKPTPQRFAIEEKLFHKGPDTGLSNDWLLGQEESTLIDKALRLAADSKYSDALSTLDQYRGDQTEFFWYYRAWILAAQEKTVDSVTAFFLVFYRHTPTPSGMFFSIQVDAARHLSQLSQNALR